MHTQSLRIRAFALVAGIAVLAITGWACADPPSRVARLGYLNGTVSFSPAGENDWVRATINRPLTTGDRLWADADARAEIQVGGAMIRMSAGTGVSVLNLDDRIAQLQLMQGTLTIRVRRLEPNQVFEVDTPNLAFTVRQPGEFRIQVDPDGNATTIVVRKGQGEVYGEDAAYVIDSRQPYRFIGTGLREYQYVDAPRFDEFDRWSSDRDRSYDNSASARYVSQDVVGYQDLDANGTWRTDTTYGNVWIPNRVAAGWAPYRDGHWAWVDPWGWTWVDDAPWGFAVSHYGRWTNLSGTWGWVPGPVRTRAYYAPALVAFVGGNNFQLTIASGNVGGIAWFPLGPREVYRPSYAVSRGYFENINRSNTVINNTVINNYYNNSNVTNVVYANRQVPGAVVAVPTTAFVQSQPVSRAAVRVTQQIVASAPVAAIPLVAPTEKSVRGAAAQGDRPPARVFERPVVARTAPPAASVGFAAQQQQLAATPGTPLDDAARKALRTSAAVPAPMVKMVAPAHTVAPTALPPPTSTSAKQIDPRGKSDERMTRPAPAISGAPGAQTQGMAPSQVTQPAPAAQPLEQRGQPLAPPPTPPQRATEPRAVLPQVALPAPAATAQPPEPRGKSEQRERPAAPPPAPSQGAAQPQVAPPQTTPLVPSTQSSEPRGKSEQRGQPVTLPPPLPQRALEPKSVPPQVAPPASTPQLLPQRSPQPNGAAPPPIAPSAPAVQQPAKLESAPVARQAAPSPPVAAPAVAAPKPPPPMPQPATKTEPRGQESKPAAVKPDEKKKDSDEQKREEENRKQKN